MAKAPRYEGLTLETTPAEAARAVIRPLLAAAIRESPAVLFEQDVRATHDMRVALRRLRTALALFARLLPADGAAHQRRSLRRLARRLGEVRDADVHLGELRGALGGATAAETSGIAAAIEALVAARRAALARFAIELSQFDREGLEALADAAEGGGTLPKFVRRTLRKRFRSVTHQAAKAFPAGGAEAVHALRKRLKALRYALEFFDSLIGPAGAQALDALGALQDRLGTIADADAFARTYAHLGKHMGRDDPRSAGLAACRATAALRREDALAKLSTLWSEDGGYPERLAASISSALGSLSPKSEA